MFINNFYVLNSSKQSNFIQILNLSRILCPGHLQANRAAEEFAKTAASASKKKFAQALSGDRMAEAKGILNESGLDRVADQTKEIADQTKSVISGLIGTC